MKQLVTTHICNDDAGHLVVVAEYEDVYSVARLSAVMGHYSDMKSWATKHGWANYADEETFQLKDGRTVKRIKQM